MASLSLRKSAVVLKSFEWKWQQTFGLPSSIQTQIELVILNLALNARDWLVRVVPETMTT